VHPRHFKKRWIINEHQNTKNQSQNTRWPSNDIPQFALHNLKLIAQNEPLMLLSFKAFRVVNEQPDNVKKSGEPAHHKN
jgi:hypothetical protein